MTCADESHGMAADLQQYLQLVAKLTGEVESRAVADPFAEDNQSNKQHSPEHGKLSSADLAIHVKSCVAAAWTAVSPIEMLRCAAQLHELACGQYTLDARQRRSINSMARQLSGRCLTAACDSHPSAHTGTSQCEATPPATPPVLVCSAALALLQPSLGSSAAQGGGLAAALAQALHRCSSCVRTLVGMHDGHAGRSADASDFQGTAVPFDGLLRPLSVSLAAADAISALSGQARFAQASADLATMATVPSVAQMQLHPSADSLLALFGAGGSVGSRSAQDQFLSSVDVWLAAALSRAAEACAAASVEEAAVSVQRIRGTMQRHCGEACAGGLHPHPFTATQAALASCQTHLLAVASAHAKDTCLQLIHTAAAVAAEQYRVAWRAASVGIPAVFDSATSEHTSDLSTIISTGRVNLYGLTMALDAAVWEGGEGGQWALKPPLRTATLAACPPSAVAMPPLEPPEDCLPEVHRSLLREAATGLTHRRRQSASPAVGPAAGTAGTGDCTCGMIIASLATACASLVQQQADSVLRSALGLGLEGSRAAAEARSVATAAASTAAEPVRLNTAACMCMDEALALVAGDALFRLHCVVHLCAEHLAESGTAPALTRAIAVAGTALGTLLACSGYTPSMRTWPWGDTEIGMAGVGLLSSHATWVRLTTDNDDEGDAGASSHVHMPLTPSHCMWDCVLILQTELSTHLAHVPSATSGQASGSACSPHSITPHSTDGAPSAVAPSAVQHADIASHSSAAAVAAGLQAFALQVAEALQLRSDALLSQESPDSSDDALRLQCLMDALCLGAAVSGACPGEEVAHGTPLHPLLQGPLDGDSAWMPLVCSSPRNFFLAAGAPSAPSKGGSGGVHWGSALADAAASLAEVLSGSAWAADLSAAFGVLTTAPDKAAWSALEQLGSSLAEAVDPVEWALCEDTLLACAAVHVQQSCVRLALTPPLPLCMGGAGGGVGGASAAVSGRPWARKAAAFKRRLPQLLPLDASIAVDARESGAVHLRMPAVLARGGQPSIEGGGGHRQWQDSLQGSAMHEAACAFIAQHGTIDGGTSRGGQMQMGGGASAGKGALLWSAENWLHDLPSLDGSEEGPRDRISAGLSTGLHLAWRGVKGGVENAQSPGCPQAGVSREASPLPKALKAGQLAQRTWGALAGLVGSTLSAGGGAAAATSSHAFHHDLDPMF